MNRLCNLDSAACFETVDENDIKGVRNFICDQLYNILQEKSKENNLNYDSKYNSEFFGLFSSSHEKFEFSIGDIKKLNVIIKHVQKIVQSEGDYSHFDVANRNVKHLIKSWQKMLIQTPAGLFFGDDVAVSVQKLPSVDEIKSVLIARAKDHFNSYQTLKQRHEFSEASVNVTKGSDGKFKGEINCIFCEHHPVAVSYLENGKSVGWSLSNLFRHFRTAHLESGNLKRKTYQTQDKDEMEIEIPKNESIAIIECSRHTVSLKIEPQFSSTDNDIDTAINTVVRKDLEEIEDILYLQGSTQIIKMKNACTSHNEVIFNFGFNKKLNQKGLVKCCRISGAEGNCLFASIAHQLFQMKVNSSKHEEYTLKLREEAVSHINQNLPRFMYLLKGRFYEDNDKYVGGRKKREKRSEEEQKQHEEQIAVKCKYFLENDLAGGVWGGTESIVALSEVYSVNILMINDNGTCNMNRKFDTKLNQTIILAFSNLNHYDSVVSIDDQNISHFAKLLVIEQDKSFGSNTDIVIDA